VLESHKLPENLYNWLFPPGGQTRHLPTLQVSFGSNDDFFASDQDGKLTSRDGTPTAERKAPPPRLADVARGFIRRKAHTISSPKLPENLQGKLEETPLSTKLERRRTFLEGQSSPRTESRQGAVLLSLSLHSRRELRGESAIKEQTSIPLTLSLHSRRESRSEMPKIEERKSLPPAVTQSSPGSDTKEELAKAEKRSMFTAVAVERQIPPSEDMQQLPVVEQITIINPPSQPQLTRLDARLDFMRSEQRRSTLNGMPRPSWPERKTLLMNRERILSGHPMTVVAPRPAYVDASVQTEFPDNEICAQLSTFPVSRSMPTIQLPPRHSVAIGSMADFFRGQYSLGDALRFV
jgi:hypothetical protein